MTPTPPKRRRFSRVAFVADAILFTPDGEYPVKVHDLSLKGALVQPNQTMYLAVGAACTLKLPLDGAGTSIRMETTVVHHMGGFYGLACTDIDLDSMTNLRTLIRLNLGDEELAEREVRLLGASAD